MLDASDKWNKRRDDYKVKMMMKGFKPQSFI